MWHLTIYRVIPSYTELADKSDLIVKAESREYEPLLRIYELYNNMKPENGYYHTVIQVTEAKYVTVDDNRPSKF